jgi:hypothetical protein
LNQALEARHSLNRLRHFVRGRTFRSIGVDGRDGKVVNFADLQAIHDRARGSSNLDTLSRKLYVVASAGAHTVVHTISDDSGTRRHVPGQSRGRGSRRWCWCRRWCWRWRWCWCWRWRWRWRWRWCWCWCWCWRWCRRARRVVALLRNSGERVTPGAAVAGNRAADRLVEVRAVGAITHHALARHGACGALGGAVHPVVAAARFCDFHLRRHGRGGGVGIGCVIDGVRCPAACRQRGHGHRPQQLELTPICVGFAHCWVPNRRSISGPNTLATRCRTFRGGWLRTHTTTIRDRLFFRSRHAALSLSVHGRTPLCWPAGQRRCVQGDEPYRSALCGLRQCATARNTFQWRFATPKSWGGRCRQSRSGRSPQRASQAPKRVCALPPDAQSCTKTGPRHRAARTTGATLQCLQMEEMTTELLRSAPNVLPSIRDLRHGRRHWRAAAAPRRD